VELLHSFIQGLLGLPYLPESLLELLNLCRPGFIKLLLLFPRGWSLATDIVKIVFAILREFRMFELPAL
jgi:hypothetical protein